MLEKYRGQIWIETVIYTLIGLSIIAILLAIIKTQIDSMKDKALIDNGLEILKVIEQKITDVRYVPGNSRLIEINLQRGKLIIHGEDDKIEYLLEGAGYEYSETNVEAEIGNIKVMTKKGAEEYDVSLYLEYDELNISFREEDVKKEFQASTTPYTLSVKNNGLIDDIVNIDFVD